MAYQATFKRYEMKYLLTEQQKRAVLQAMQPYMKLDGYGIPLLGKGQTLMEIKTSGGLPLWMSHELSRLKVYQTSFSKYGLAYQNMMTKSNKQEQRRILHAC